MRYPEIGMWCAILHRCKLEELDSQTTRRSSGAAGGQEWDTLINAMTASNASQKSQYNIQASPRIVRNRARLLPVIQPSVTSMYSKDRDPMRSNHEPRSCAILLRFHPCPGPSHISLPRPLEEEPHNEDLQSRHRNHHQPLNDTKIEDPPLGTPDRAEIPVLSCPKVFL